MNWLMEHLEGDPELPTPVPNPIILPDYGDKANYRLGENVTFSVFDPEYKEVTILCDGNTVLTLAVSEDGTATTDRTEYQEGEEVHVVFSCKLDHEPVGFMVKTDKSAKYWGYMKQDGTLPDAVQLPAGDYYIIAPYRNRYGVCTATPTPVFHITGK